MIDPKQMNHEEEGHEAGKEDAGECTAELAAEAGEVSDRQNAGDTCLVNCDAEVKMTEDNGSRQKECNSKSLFMDGIIGWEDFWAGNSDRYNVSQCGVCSEPVRDYSYPTTRVYMYY